MSINLKAPELRELKPRIMVAGVGGAGGNAVNNMIASGLVGVDFIVANTDAQALTASKAERIIQMGLQVTEGLGAGSQPEVGRAAAEEAIEEIRDHLSGAHMCFVTGGMGGGTGTGAAPVIAQTARDMGILTVGVVTKPFQFEGQRRMRIAEAGIRELQACVDTLIVIPNQNLFRVATEKTTFADAFAMADQVLYSGVACITDLMVKEGLINLDFADVRAVMREMGKAMMGTGEASGDGRAVQAAEAAIANPLLDETSMKGARGLLISITGGSDLTLYEVDEAASRIRQEVDEEANIILGATFDNTLDGIIRVSVVATGIDQALEAELQTPAPMRMPEIAVRPRPQVHVAPPAPAPQMQPVQVAQEAREAFEAHIDEFAAEDLAAAMEEAIAPAQPAPVQYARQPERAAVPAPQAERVEVAPYATHAEADADEVLRPTRMPKVEELPMPVQEQLRAHRGDGAGMHGAEQKRRSLLERLASFSINRDVETDRPAAEQLQAPAPVVQAQPRPAPIPPQPVQQHPVPPHAAMPPPVHAQAPAPAQPPRPAPAPASAAAPGPAHAAYGKRPPVPAARPHQAHQAQLDLHGRAQPQQPRQIEDEQLDIPAFLRRQTG